MSAARDWRIHIMEAAEEGVKLYAKNAAKLAYCDSYDIETS